MPPGLATCCRRWRSGAPLDVLRTAVSLLGAELGWRPTHDIERSELCDAGAPALRRRPDDPGRGPPVARRERSRSSLGRISANAANYLFMLTGEVPDRRRTPGPSSST